MLRNVVIGCFIAGLLLMGVSYWVTHYNTPGIGMENVQFTLTQGDHRVNIPMKADIHWMADFRRTDWSPVTITNPNPQKYFLTVDNGDVPVKVRYSGRLVGDAYLIRTYSLTDSSLVTSRYLQIS